MVTIFEGKTGKLGTNCLCFYFFLFYFFNSGLTWNTFSQVEQSKVLIKEGGVQLLLTIVDTPGFGDAVDNSNW